MVLRKNKLITGTNEEATSQPPYGRSESTYPYYPNTNSGRNRFKLNDPKKKPYNQLKPLKLFISDNGRFVNYYLNYNESKAGFWYSSGPHNGTNRNKIFELYKCKF